MISQFTPVSISHHSVQPINTARIFHFKKLKSLYNTNEFFFDTFSTNPTRSCNKYSTRAVCSPNNQIFYENCHVVVLRTNGSMSASRMGCTC